MRPILVITLSLVLVACGAGVTEDENRKAPAGGGGRLVPKGQVTEVGGGRGGSGQRPDPLPPDLAFRVHLARDRFFVGRPIRASLSLRNVSRFGINLYSPQESLVRDLRYRLVRPDGTLIVLETKLAVPEATVRDDQIEALPNGAEIGAVLDLAPMLAEAGRGAPGNYEILIAYTGGYQGKHLNRDLWNRTGMREARARPFTIQLIAPEVPVGPTGPMVRGEDLDPLLADTGPNGELSASSRRKIGALGKRAYPALVLKLKLAASARLADQDAGWNAFEILKSGGYEAATSLVDFGEKGGIHDFLRSWLETDTPKGEKDRPAGADLANELFDLGRRTAVVLRLTRIRGQDRDVATIHGDGYLETEIHEAGEVRTVRGRLAPKAMDTLCEVLVKERLWLQTGIRRGGLKGEALIRLDRLRLEKSGSRYVERRVQRVETWERETVLNRSLAAILRAIDTAVEASKAD